MPHDTLALVVDFQDQLQQRRVLLGVRQLQLAHPLPPSRRPRPGAVAGALPSRLLMRPQLNGGTLGRSIAMGAQMALEMAPRRSNAGLVVWECLTTAAW